MRYRNYTKEGVERGSQQKRGMKARGDGRGLGFPVPALHDSLSRITSFPNERGAGPTLGHRAQVACQITITTGMTHNVPHRSLERRGWRCWGNTAESPDDILQSPQTQHTPLTGQKPNRVQCGYYNCGWKMKAYSNPQPSVCHKQGDKRARGAAGSNLQEAQQPGTVLTHSASTHICLQTSDVEINCVINTNQAIIQ